MTLLTSGGDHERDHCRASFLSALKWLLLLAVVWVLLGSVWTSSSYVFLVGMAVYCGLLYHGWRTLWYGTSLVALLTPTGWRAVVQAGIVLLAWLGPLVYFVPSSSTLASIVERTSPSTILVAGILGLFAYGLASADRKAAFRLPVRPLLVGVAVVAALCYMTKHNISLGSSDEDGYLEPDYPSRTSGEERAYVHYILYSTFVVGGILVAGRSHLTGAGPDGGRPTTAPTRGNH